MQRIDEKNSTSTGNANLAGNFWQFFYFCFLTEDLIVTIFMTIDAWFVILWDIVFFEKRTW